MNGVPTCSDPNLLSAPSQAKKAPQSHQTSSNAMDDQASRLLLPAPMQDRKSPQAKECRTPEKKHHSKLTSKKQELKDVTRT